MGLISIDRAKLARSLRDVDAAILAQLVEAASVIVEGFCGQSLLFAETTESYDGDGAGSLLLNRYPVAEIDSVIVTEPDGTETEYDGDLFTFVAATGLLRCNRSGADGALYVFPRGDMNISVTYSAGYKVVPQDLQHAVVMIVSQLASNECRDPSVKSEKFGSMSQTVRDDVGAIPPEVRSILTSYRSRVLLSSTSASSPARI